MSDYDEMTLKKAKRDLDRKTYYALRKIAKEVAQMNGEKLNKIKIVAGDNITLFVPPQPIRPVFEDMPNCIEQDGDSVDIKMGGRIDE